MHTQIEIGEIAIKVIKKDIKNLHLSVNPPDGKVRISAPLRTTLQTIRLFAISKLGWIKQQQKKLQGQERETPREYLDRESHYVWGKRYLLKVIEQKKKAGVELQHNTMVLSVRPGAGNEKKRALVEAWYRDRLRTAAQPLIAKWELLMGVKVSRLFVQRMKTRWGSCKPDRKHIRLNTELAKKPIECLEYVVVHEMSHFFERRHNDRFMSMMDRYLPQWRHYREVLNVAPLSHAEWSN
ncbi:MAG: M48 family metallopeptidase [Hyphomicrobiaceae bacterium]